MRRRNAIQPRSFLAETLEPRVLLAGDLVAHWRAHELVETTANGGAVSAWTDIVGQTVAEIEQGAPTLHYTSVDGRAGVRFDASDGADLLQVAASNNPIANDVDYSLVVVFSTSATEFRDVGPLWYQKTGLIDGNQNGFGADYGVAFDASANIVAGTSVGFLSPGANVTSAVDNLNDGARHVAFFTRDGSDVSLYVDDAAPVTASNAGSDPTAASAVLAIGGLATKNGPFTGDIAEVRVYNGKLTDAEVATVNDEISAFYSNAAPQAVDDAYTVAEDSTGLLIAPANGVLANDFDADGDSLVARIATETENGTISLQENGSFLYNPNPDFFGTDTFTYSAVDSRPSTPATVTITVSPINDPPVANADAFFGVVDEPIVATVDTGLLANDFDIDNPNFTAVLVQGPASGQLALNADGSFTFTPNVGFEGTDNFTYQASDGVAMSEVVDVNLFVGGTPLRISEILAVNVANIETRVREDAGSSFRGERLTPDWIEIQNLSSAAIDIGGFHLTDDQADLTKWQFPSDTSIPANGSLTVFASRLNITDPTLDEQSMLHTNFVLTIGGEYLALTDADGNVLDDFGSGYPQQFPEISYGWTIEGELFYLTEITRGGANSGGYLGVVKDTSFSIDRGFYNDPIQVEIATRSTEATIRYTLDGSQPTDTHGTEYSGAITIDRTTTLRAAAFLEGYIPSNVDTQTYLFVDQVLQQSTTPTVGPTNNVTEFPDRWRAKPADYEMDPEILNDPAYSGHMVDAMLALPSLSLTFDQEDIFGRNGLYSNPQGTNEETASAELIFPDGRIGFQIDAGARMQGGASRNPDHLKHSMSLRFREDYGDSQLDYPLFANSGVTQFDSVHLRARYNNSWIHWDQGQRNRGMMMREAFMRDTMLAAGEVAAGHGNFVHLYLNGLYWGIYEMHERQDASHFAAYHGGESYEYAATNANAVVDGDSETFSELQSVVRSQDWERIQEVLDVDNHILFNIAQLYGGNQDLKADGNWRSAGGGTAGAPWEFYMWDVERVLENPRQNGTSPVPDLMGFLGRLDDIEEYVVRFGDQVHRLFFNDGALTPENAAARWTARFEELETAIIAESARWGDARQSTPLTKNERWLPEHNRLLEDYFPVRTENVLQQFRSRRVPLYPATNAPEFLVNGNRRHGGTLDFGESLSILNPDGNGTIYYTLDGSDPRQVGGAVSPSANVFAAAAIIELSESAQVRMRILNGDEWSAITEATFLVEQVATASNVRISEINYHPHDAQTAFGEPDVSDSQFEFIEVMNTSNDPVNLSGMRFQQVAVDGNAEGITFVFDTQVLAPQQRIVIARNVEAFRGRYGNDISIAAGNDGLAGPQGQWGGGKLSDGGETLTLVDANGATIQQITYSDGGRWANRADGVGSTLEFVAGSAEANDGQSWTASSEVGGTPGSSPSAFATTIVINEVLSNSDAPVVDTIELHNVSDSTVNLSGYFLTDSASNLAQYALSPGTSITSGGYVVLTETETGFGLKGDVSDDIWLIEPDADGRPFRFVDAVDFGATETNTSLGRWPNGSGELFPMSNTSFGGTNSGPIAPAVVISELNYHPLAGDAQTSDGLEFVELFNPSGSVQDLSGWRLNKAIDYTFPADSQLPAEGAVVVVPFDPSSDAQQVASFRANYGIPEQVVLMGPYSGVLDNGGERLEVDRPALADDAATGYILVDRVRYDDDAPWPTTADGTGASLTRLGMSSYGNDETSWFSGSPTPGTVQFEPPAVDLDNNGVVDADDIAIICGSLNSGGPEHDLNGDNSFDINDFYFIVRDWLRTDAGDANLDQVFNSTDLVAVFTAGEYEDGIPGNSTWAEGDWNCDGEFGTSDLVAAFQAGNYVAAATQAAGSPANAFAASRFATKATLGETKKVHFHPISIPRVETAKSSSLESPVVVDQVFAAVADFDLQLDDADDAIAVEDLI